MIGTTEVDLEEKVKTLKQIRRDAKEMAVKNRKKKKKKYLHEEKNWDIITCSSRICCFTHRRGATHFWNHRIGSAESVTDRSLLRKI